MENEVLDASKVLEAALQQMDGFISGTSSSSVMGNGNVNANGSGNGNGGVVGSGGGIGLVGSSTSAAAALADQKMKSLISLTSTPDVLTAAKALSSALQEAGPEALAPDPLTAEVIKNWLFLSGDLEINQKRVQLLHMEKDLLATEYEKLAKRCSEQASKIIELEGLLTEKTQLLGIKEEQLQKQLLSRSALETQHLELMSALSELKLHRAVLEKENADLQENGNGNDSSQYHSLGNSINMNKNSTPTAPKTPPASFRHQIHPQFHSLPRSYAAKQLSNNSKSSNNNNNNRVLDANANASIAKQRNVAFASNEKILIDDVIDGKSENDSLQNSYGNSAKHSPTLTKSLRHIFGKFRRSNSGNLEIPESGDDFKRGGTRATTSGRLEWSSPSNYQISQVKKDYKDWSVDEVCNWLCELDLPCYAEACKKWLSANPSVCFFTVSPVDIDRELHLKMPLHRKKIVLAIDVLVGKEVDSMALKASNLDVAWVLRWLDDIGLPQYKDEFLQAKVDGRMLHRLTLEDLAQLHVYSCLHIASFHRGIQCMREMDWQPDCLIRRSTVKADAANAAQEEQNDSVNENGSNKQSNDSSNSSSSSESGSNEPKENIALWTAHRVMEWLRVADLSEYAPNLRGAGVHGALMLYEDRFNPNLLADLLSIPPSKSLLRRHLATQFKELLGRDVIQAKRDAEVVPGYQPLSLTAKIKPAKKLHFSLIRRKSHKGTTDIEWSDYVCPMMGLCTSNTVGANNEEPSQNAHDTSKSSANNPEDIMSATLAAL